MAATDYENPLGTAGLFRAAGTTAPLARTVAALQRRHEPHHAAGRIRVAGAVLAVTLAALLSTSGCSFAVDHPAVAAGVVGGTLGLATCELASDDIAACLAVGGGAGAFLGLVAATAIWLGGDGHTVMAEEQAQPLPEDSRPRRRGRTPPVDPAASDVDPAAIEPDQPPADPAPTSTEPAGPSGSRASRGWPLAASRIRSPTCAPPDRYSLRLTRSMAPDRRFAGGIRLWLLDSCVK